MKYSDQQRIAKMRETVEKLLRYVSEEGITPDRIFAEETIQRTVTTPLYNIGEHAANLTEDFKSQHPDIPVGENCGFAAQVSASLRGYQLDCHMCDHLRCVAVFS